MNIVIQCAASKRPTAGLMLDPQGYPVMFVAEPALAPTNRQVRYARPDDSMDGKRTWRDALIEANQEPSRNAMRLLQSIDLYENPIYRRLATRFGTNKLFILSAGWGLLASNFLTPAYDITFSQSAEPYKRRRPAQLYADLNMLPLDSNEPVLFLGGKDYLPLFERLTRGALGERVVMYNSANPPRLSGCRLHRFVTTTRTNWHYECANALIEGCVQV